MRTTEGHGEGKRERVRGGLGRDHCGLMVRIAGLLITLSRRRPFGDPGELLVVGKPWRQAWMRAGQIGAVGLVERVDQVAQPVLRVQHRGRDVGWVLLEQRACPAGVEAAGQMPVDQFAGLARAVRRRSRRSAAIAASSSNCGARPASTSFWVGGSRSCSPGSTRCRPRSARSGRRGRSGGTGRRGGAVRWRRLPPWRSRRATLAVRRSASVCATQSAMRSRRGDHHARKACRNPASASAWAIASAEFAGRRRRARRRRACAGTDAARHAPGMP